MITAIHKSMAAKRDAVKNDDKGFTLIELLVVVLIIGILAAIAIPVFLGQQASAKDSAAKSDLGNAKTAYISFQTTNGATATVTAAGLKSNGYTGTDGTSAFAIKGGTAGAFCIQETAATNNVFSLTDSGGVADGACNATTYPTAIYTVTP